MGDCLYISLMWCSLSAENDQTHYLQDDKARSGPESR